jgi:hypothetical protein
MLVSGFTHMIAPKPGVVCCPTQELKRKERDERDLYNDAVYLQGNSESGNRFIVDADYKKLKSQLEVSSY